MLEILSSLLASAMVLFGLVMIYYIAEMISTLFIPTLRRPFTWGTIGGTIGLIFSFFYRLLLPTTFPLFFQYWWLYFIVYGLLTGFAVFGRQLLISAEPADTNQA